MVWETKSGYRIFSLLDGQNKCYLLTSEIYNILIDTGSWSEYNKILANIENLNLVNKTIDFLILTHSHYDHCQNAKQMQDKWNCKILVSEKAKEHICNGYAPVPKAFTIFKLFISTVEKFRGTKQACYPPFIVDIFVKNDFDFSQYGMNIKLIETTGHTDDSICIIIDDEIAIVGDTMSGIFKNSIMPVLFDSKQELLVSWKKLLDTKCNLFLAGHGKPIDRRLLEKEYIKHTN